jgi:hypothetical protein
MCQNLFDVRKIEDTYAREDNLNYVYSGEKWITFSCSTILYKDI